MTAQTDRELLELAAKAINLPAPDGFHRVYGFIWVTVAHGARHESRWNPLNDDGDALRLAVKLHLEIDHNHPQDSERWVMALENGKMVGPEEEIEDESQRCEATRRAIVRAAAAIAENTHG